MKMTRAKTGARRANHALEGPRLAKDAETGEQTPRHRASATTGRYRGRVVVDMTAKLKKREAKRKAREREAARMGESLKEEKPADAEKPAEAPKQAPLDAAKLSQAER